MKQPLALALALALALVPGCIGSQKADDPVEPAAATPSAAPEEAPAAEEGSAASSSSSAPPPSNSSSASSSSPPSSGSPPAAPPAPPKPAPWNLTETAKLGWTAAAGAPDPVAQEHGLQKDAEHCPDATFLLPVGAMEIAVTAQQVYAQQSPGAGAMRILVTDPDGKALAIEPQPGAGASVVLTIQEPKAGPWALHAEPVGPVVAQTWSIALDAKGTALAAPTGLALATSC